MRIQSILRKAKARAHGGAAPILHSPEERDPGACSWRSVGDALAAAEDKRAPNILCDYAFTLAQNFSRFYAEHHILSESDAAARRPAGPLRPDPGGFGPDSGPSGHRSSRKNVSKFGVLTASFDFASAAFRMHRNIPSAARRAKMAST